MYHYLDETLLFFRKECCLEKRALHHEHNQLGYECYL